jgi:hypothetical protein
MRSREVDAELLELVNNNYSVFLNLGVTLKGGEDKVEEVRVGLLGFQREISLLKGRITESLDGITKDLRERERIQETRRIGAKLVEFDGRIEVLELQLMLTTGESGIEDFEDEGQENDEELASIAPPLRLAKTAQDYLYLVHMAENELPPGHPFVKAQEARIARIKSTILLDLGTAAKATIAVAEPGTDRLLKIMQIYADLDEAQEGIKILKGSKKK